MTPVVENQTLRALASALESGATTSRALVEACLARIDDPDGEGRRAFLHVSRKHAQTAADAMDVLRQANAAPSRYAGIPVSIKDLFDAAGEVTCAGSRVLANAAPAKHDAVAVARLKRAGFVVIGRTNMTEFAFSGLGLNPHYGTPRGVWDRQTGHIPGGSSSGAAVSVADGMAHAALGTDTGGSCRIPAAFNRLVGFKPTARRVPRDGALPLSTTLDSVGPIARSVNCCAVIDSYLSGEGAGDPTARDPRGLRLAVPISHLLNDMDDVVAKEFAAALSRLSAAGIDIREVPFPEFDEIPAINAKGGFSPPEALAWHAPFIASSADFYDPRVLVRIKRGLEQSAVDYIRLTQARNDLIARVTTRMAAFDALVFPTVPITPPRLEAFESDADYARLNALCLRNPSVVNVIDGCAISVPVSRSHEAPVGLTVAMPGGCDKQLFQVAGHVETIVRGS